VRHSYATSILAVYLVGFGFAARIEAQAFATSNAVTTFENQPIVSVNFEPAQQPLDANEMAGILPVKAGRPYRAADVRNAIERLYATGRYQDIQVDATPAANGLAVRFITKNSWFVGDVSADEDFSEPPSTGQIVNAAHLDLGTPFDPAQVPAAVENIRKLLIDNGYFNPRIDPDVRYNNAYQQVDVTFRIKTGRRARYNPPSISGDTIVLTQEEIIKATRWRRFLLPGYRGVTESRTRTGIDRIRLKYTNANRLLATVVLSGIDKDEDTNRATAAITVNPGQPVIVKALGATISEKQLRENVPVFEEHSVDADLLAEGAGDLRDYFQAQGYFDVTVEFRQIRREDGGTEIDYAVERGARHRFAHLEITGNKYFDIKTIRERMFLTPSSFETSRGRYSEAFLRRDRQTIGDLYESNGFRDAQITSRAADNYKGKTGDVAVFLTIDEGPQYFVSSLNIKGPNKLDLTKVIASLSSEPGQIFSEFNVAADRETIIRYYGENGFANATFEWDSKPAAKPHTFDLEFIIDEGDQQFVREVVTSGLEKTQPSLVQKQLELTPGAPLSPVAMSGTQQKLYDLGIFSKVDMAIQNPDGEEAEKYVLYDLEEARRYTITTGLGAEFARIGGGNAITDLADPGGGPGFSPRVSVDVTRLNLFGLGQSLSFQGRLSTLQKRALVKHFVPKIFDHPSLDATFSILYDDTHDVRTFESKREEASARITQRLSKPITLFYGFTYRHVGVSNLKIDPLLLPQLAQSVRVGLASFNLVQDRRDDPLDPHKGIYNTIAIDFASKVFASQTSFARILGRNATYYKLGDKWVFARETQVGIQPAFNIPSTADPTDPIPLAERFFAGGGNTQRGFPDNQAGPRDLLTGFPLGGSAFLFNNTELRFPLYGANVNGVLFEDAGNVYSSLGNISFRVDQRNNSDFDYMVHAVGFGVRYRTPIGPLRLDLAYSINPPRYNGFPGSYSQLVSCSAANTCQASLQQISHFQFFFSIGQAF
jgi:outer membrane protein assembly complex protein YaeT